MAIATASGAAGQRSEGSGKQHKPNLISDHFHHHPQHNYHLIIIIFTRPKPPVGRLVLAESLGKDTVSAVHSQRLTLRSARIGKCSFVTLTIAISPWPSQYHCWESNVFSYRQTNIASKYINHHHCRNYHSWQHYCQCPHLYCLPYHQGYDNHKYHFTARPEGNGEERNIYMLYLLHSVLDFFL